MNDGTLWSGATPVADPALYEVNATPGLLVEIVAEAGGTAWQRANGAKIVRVAATPPRRRRGGMQPGYEFLVLPRHLHPVAR